jgi:hypothetical protein
MLAELSKTHILVAVFPLSLTEINIRTHNKGIFCGPDLYKKDFSDDDCSLASWMLIKREPVEDSFLKNWSEQEELVYSSCDDEDSPGVQVLAYAIVGHYLASGEKLFKNCFVRTSSIGPRKNTHVDVGPFGLHGLGISYNPDDRKAPNMGIASFRDFYFNLFFLPRRAMCPGLLFTI